MEITEKEVALLAKGLEILLNDRADKLGAYDMWGRATWMGPPPIKDSK